MRKTKKILPLLFGFVSLLGLIGLFVIAGDIPHVETPLIQDQSSFIKKPNLKDASEETFGSEFFIESLRRRNYLGGEIKLEEVLKENSRFTSYLFSYPSEGLKIVGVLNVPNGRGPFPAIILAHGYYNPKTFKAGTGTEREANFLAEHGYVTFAPNFRGFGESEDDGNSHLFRADFAIDVLELLASIKKSVLFFLDKDRVGMWGHSMGGGISERVATSSDKIKAYVLFGPVESDAWDDFNRFAGRRPEVKDLILKEIGTKEEKLKFWKNISPIYFVQYISAPVQLHHGSLDATVPIASSKMFHQALSEADKKSEFFIYEGQGHFLQGAAWNLAMQRVLAFYDHYVRGQ